MKSTCYTFLTALLFLFFSFNAQSQGIIDSNLQSVLQSADGPVQVIVTFEGDSAPSEQEIGLLESVGIDTGILMNSLPIAGVLATQSQVEELANQPGIRSLYHNEPLEYYNDNGTALTGVDRVRTNSHFQSLNNGMPVTGKGVGVVVNDSGIDALHPDHKLGDHVVQNVLASLNLNALTTGIVNLPIDVSGPVTILEDQPNTDTNSGHGTHVAGTIGATGAQSNGLYEGVAPGADLIGYGSGAALLVLDGLGGIDYSITNQARYNIRVVNNSWGGSGAFDPDHPINVASKRAFDRGIAVVFAAGNSGPGRDTHNPYAKAPWVISVGAGTHDGDLTSFSSRGSNTTFDFEMDGETFTMVDEPTIVAPGEDIISTRTLSPVGVLSIDMDLLNLDPGHLPYYTHSSGTSMAAPHVAGVIALMLEANPSLNVTEIKEILRKTATNMTGREAFEVGAGYVNAFAAVQMAYDMAVPYGASVNNTREFNSTIDLNEESEEFEVSFGLLGLTSTSHTFEVEEGTNAIEARISALGLAGEGNLLNLVVEDPDGNIASSGIPVLFPLEIARNVLVTNPTPGTWEVRVEGLRGDDAVPLEIGLPETVNGTLTRFMAAGTTGLNDIEGHEAEDAIMVGVGQRLLDGLPDGNFKPDEKLTRMQLADYLMMGQQVRQNLPTDGSSFGDVSGELNTLIAQSVTAKGAAIADTFQVADGVMLPKSGGFSPNGTVNKVDLAYSLVQSLGLQKQARSLNDEDVTVLYDGDRVTMDDQNDIPSDMRGYVQLALDFNILGAEFELTQGRFDLFPTLTAKFNPDQEVTRADFALAVTRAQEVEAGSGGSSGILSMFSKENDIESEESEKPEVVALDQNYPNPFNPSTVISYSLPEQTDVSITVYNMAGQQIQTLVNEVQSAGTYQVNFDASNLASGVYMYRLQAGSQVITKQMNFIK